MTEDQARDYPGTDPETQREELIRRSKVAHPAEERSKMLNTTRPREGEEREGEGREERE